VPVNSEQQISNAVEKFAAELRAWRIHMGLSQNSLGDLIGYSGSHVSSVETMQRTPVLDFAKKCDKALATPGTFERMHDLIAREAYPPWFAPFVHLEQAATRISSWESRCFTGLLQTVDYARAICRAGHPEWSDDLVEKDVAGRIDRQKILDRGILDGERPPSCWFVISEAAFRTIIGDEAVLSSQISHVAELARLPSITVQVYPFSVPDCPGIDGPVTLFEFETRPSAGYAEGYEAGRTIESPRDVAMLVAMFDHLRAAALSPRDSATWIATLGSELYEQA
jgi:transcriptional regulator with XRE-family HTH domain